MIYRKLGRWQKWHSFFFYWIYVQQVEIAEPGSRYTEAGAKIAIDPTWVSIGHNGKRACPVLGLFSNHRLVTPPSIGNTCNRSRVIAISALQNHIKLVFLRDTKRSQFDPVERVRRKNIGEDRVGYGKLYEFLPSCFLPNHALSHTHTHSFHQNA